MLHLLGSHAYTTKTPPDLRVRLRGLSGLEYMEFQELVRIKQSPEVLKQIDPYSRTKAELVKEAAEGGDPAGAQAVVLHREVCEFVLRKGVVAVEDEAAIDGAPAPDLAAIVTSLSYGHIAELVARILLFSQLTEDQVKNSLSQSKSTPPPSDSIVPSANGADTATPAIPPAEPSSKSPGSLKATSA